MELVGLLVTASSTSYGSNPSCGGSSSCNSSCGSNSIGGSNTSLLGRRWQRAATAVVARCSSGSGSNMNMMNDDG